jgi:hypothetical protein
MPSGILVIGIDPWVERFEKIFQNVRPDKKAEEYREQIPH